MIKLSCLNLCDLIFGYQSICDELNTIALSHGEVNITVDCVRRLKLNMQIKILSLYLAVDELGTLCPAEDDGKFTVLELRNKWNLDLGAFAWQSEEGSLGSIECSVLVFVHGNLVLSNLRHRSTIMLAYLYKIVLILQFEIGSIVQAFGQLDDVSV